MEYWAGVEAYQPAYDAIRRCRLAVDRLFAMAFSSSSLADLKAKLRYVPIIMPVGMRECYPARSKLRKKQRLYDCSPQLNYDVFVTGSFEDQLREYLGGMAETVPHLASLGATPEQIADFEAILATAVEQILKAELDQTRH